MRLDDNSNTQRELNQEAFHTDMDLKSKQMQQNIEVGGFKILKADNVWVLMVILRSVSHGIMIFVSAMEVIFVFSLLKNVSRLHF